MQWDQTIICKEQLSSLCTRPNTERSVVYCELLCVRDPVLYDINNEGRGAEENQTSPYRISYLHRCSAYSISDRGHCQPPPPKQHAHTDGGVEGMDEVTGEQEPFNDFLVWQWVVSICLKETERACECPIMLSPCTDLHWANILFTCKHVISSFCYQLITVCPPI